MEIFKIEFILIINMYFADIAISEHLEIFRFRSDGDDGWKQGTDSFKIPSSLCDQNKSDSINCARFNADVKSEDGERCFCSCSNEEATLMFSNNEWRCLKNDNVLILLGYDQITYTGFDYDDGDGDDDDDDDDDEEEEVQEEGINNKLRMLNINDRRPLSLALWPQCVVDQDSSWYIGCDGSEVPFRSSLFTIQKINEDIPFVIKVKEGVSDAEFLKGRIINLGIRCTVINNVFTRKRLLFKYEGKLTCPVSASTVQSSVTTTSLYTAMTLSPSTTTSSTTEPSLIISIVFPTVNIPGTGSDTSATVSYTPSTDPEMLSTVSDTPLRTLPDIVPTTSTPVSGADFSTSSTTINTAPKVSEVQPTVSDTLPTALVSSPTTQDTMTVSPLEVLDRPSPGSQQSTGNNSSSLSLGLTVGLPASLLAVVAFVGVLVYRHRRTNAYRNNPSLSTNSEKEKATVIVSAQTNSGYGLDDNSAYEEVPPICVSNYEELYFNSDKHSSDNTPQADHTYAPLNFPDSQNINSHGNNKEQLHRVVVNPLCVKGVKSQAYTRAIRPISMEQPVYNLIEEFSLPAEDGQEQDGVNDKEEEAYLEPVDSDGTVHHGTTATEEPVYHTLEE